MSPSLGRLLKDKAASFLIPPYFCPCMALCYLERPECCDCRVTGRSAGSAEAVPYLCLSCAGNTREMNGFGSPGNRTAGLQGEAGRWERAAGRLGNGHVWPHVVFAEWLASAPGSRSCSLCFAVNCAPGKFGNLLSGMLTWTNITVV